MKATHDGPEYQADALVKSMLYALRTEDSAADGTHAVAVRRIAPFVTISRQAGAGGKTLARRLVERLREIDPIDPADSDGGRSPWACWDHELVEKVSSGHHIAEALVEALEDSRRPWIQEFLAGLGYGGELRHPEEFTVYRRVAAAIRALAAAGRAVIVGRGAVHITAGMPGGLHIRLVAPLGHRVAHMARRLGVPAEQAAERVAEIDRNRAAFYRRYWPQRSLAPEAFTVTFNTAGLNEGQMAAAIVPLLYPGLVTGESAAARPPAPHGSPPARVGTLHAGAT